MTAQLIQFPEPPKGNGAREALADIVNGLTIPVLPELAEMWADQLLLELWARGYKVVPLDINAAD